MTVGEIIQRVKSLYNQGVGYVDSELSDRHIYNKLLTVRYYLLEQKYKQGIKDISEKSLLTLGCVELIESTPYDCNCVAPVGCNILRTKHKLPEILTLWGNYMIKSVTNITGDIIFNKTEWHLKKYKAGNKYTANKPDYFLKNDYLYLTTFSKLKLISITALFKDPAEAKKISYCGSQDDDLCVDIKDTQFLIDDDLLELLIQQTFQELIQIMKTGQSLDEQQGGQQERTN